MKKVKRIAAIVLACMSVVGVSGCQNKNPNDSTGDSGDVPAGIQMKDDIVLKDVERAKNVILLIGDGMGRNHVHAGEVYKESKLAMQNFPYSVHVETCSYDAEVTDSAAGATAIATGKRTNNGCVALDPITEEPLETIVDIAASLGKRTGIIATEDLWGATPMGFSGHADNRGDKAALLTSASTTSNANLLISYKMAVRYENVFPDAGYEKIDDVTMISDATSDKVFGGYFIDAEATSMSPDPAKMALDYVVTEALEYLSKDEDGFFLMTEGSHIDHGGHNNDITYMLKELLAFDDAIKAVLKWAEGRNDTVVIVTADHETGGLQLDPNATHQQMQAEFGYRIGECFLWTSTGHTETDVNCYINGANIDFANYSFGTQERIKNIDVFEIMKSLMLGK